ncbi:MAG: T9SS type A sorting domain-containing protein [Chitinophagales bacterium]
MQISNTITSRTLIESAYSFAKSEKEFTAYVLAQDAEMMDADAIPDDSLLNQALAKAESPEADLQLGNMLLHQGDQQRGSALLSSIGTRYPNFSPSEIEKSVQLSAIFNDTLPIPTLVQNNSALLNALSQLPYGIARIRARNILTFTGNGDYADEPLLPTEMEGKKEQFKKQAVKFNSNQITIYPNPAGNYFNLSYKLGQSAAGVITVIDMYGRTVYSDKISGSYGVKSVATNQWANGNYYISFRTSTGFITGVNLAVIK